MLCMCPGLNTRSFARANDAKIGRSRYAQCNTESTEESLQDVRANCFCASLLRTQIHMPRHASSTRAPSTKMDNDRADGHRRFHGRRRHLGSGANAAKFTVNVWEKS